jgi:hypothetical protein
MAPWQQRVGIFEAKPLATSPMQEMAEGSRWDMIIFVY